MPERHLLPIPLPHGRDGRTGYLSVFMSPRLKEAGDLEDYREWLRWPDFIAATGFQVTVNGMVVPSAVVSVAPEPDLWTATFRPDTPVKAHRFEDWTDAELVDVPTSELRDAVLELYTDMAVAYPTGAPNGDGLVELPAASLLTEGTGLLDRALDALAPIETDDTETLEEPRDPEWDFHAYLSLLGAHPQLLRQLGLIVDLEVALPVNPVGVTVQTQYAAMFGASGAFEVPVTMRTTSDFLALPHLDSAYRELLDGYFLLGDSYATLLDTAGSAARLAGVHARTAAAELSEDEPTPGSGALPVLSTRALTLVRPDQTKALTARLKRQGELESEVRSYLDGIGPPPVVYGEDVVRGHRVDVLDLTEADADGPTWRSLFERTSAEGYHFPDDEKLDRPADDDEGWGQLLLSTEIVEVIAEPVDDRDDPIARSAPHRTTDAFHRWDNWSGAVPRPTNRYDSDGMLVEAGSGTPTGEQPVQFAVDYQARPGTLPRLRCSRDYRMRARAVDLAGWSPAVHEKSPDGTETPDETFGRLEPIAAPTVVRRTSRPTPGVGDMAATVVLKSDYDIDDGDVAPDERLLFPDEVGQDLVELHDLPAGGADPASYAELVARSATKLGDDWTSDDATGEPIAEGPPRRELDYLVDPMVGGLRAEHYGRREVYSIDRTGEWPELTSNRIVVSAGEGDTEVTPDDDTDLHLFLPKAEITSIDLSYAPTDGMLTHYGLWHQLDETEQGDLRAGIEAGAHWMFSSRQRLSLVHAVRRPLTAPSTTVLTPADRLADSTAITYDATVVAERRSTGSIAMRAHWVDLVDDPTLPAPEERPATTLLGRFDTPRQNEPDPTEQDPVEVMSHRSELGDTKRHLAHVSVEAYSSFSHYFTEQRTVQVELGGAELDPRGVAANTVVVIDEHGHRSTPGTDFIVFALKGNIRFPATTNLRLGSEVTVRYVPLPISRTSDEHGPGFEVLIPNTAVPDHPSVLEVAPAARRTIGGSTHHDGRVIRVHLARPWNLTGDGEQLAVVIDPDDADGTTVARDPIVTGRAPAEPLTTGDFPLATDTATSDDGHHELAIHDVVFDESLGHWIADIAIDTPLYRPFVRLVLARYQGDSIAGRHDGPTVTLDPMRVGVDRTVTHTVTGDTHDITVVGIDHGGKPTVADPMALNTVTVRVQETDPTISDPDLRWTIDLDSAVLEPSSDAGPTTWTGAITVPSDGAPRRLVVEEVEPATRRDDPSSAGGQIVYTEIIEI